MRRENAARSDRATAVKDPDEDSPDHDGAVGAESGAIEPLEPVGDDLAALQSRRTRRVLLGAAIGLVLVVLISALVLRREQPAQPEAAATAVPAAAAAPVTISTATAAVRELPIYIEATGSLTPYETTDVAPETSGQIVSTPVDVGDYVRWGQVIARLDDRDARLRVQQAEAAVRQAEAGVKQSRARLGLEGGERLDPSRVAEVESARAQMELAEVTERRYRNLVETGDVSRAQYDETHARAETARQQYQTALASARSGGAGIEVASTSVEAARAQLALARKALADTAITAPFDGYVGDRPVAPGEWVTPTSKVATIVQTGILKLLLTISESDAGQIRTGMPVVLTVDAYPGREFRGLVGAIVPSLDAASRSLVAVVGVPNPEGLLRPGMFASGRVLEPNEGRRGVVVPREAVVPASGSSSRVFVIRDGRAEGRVVQIGQAEGGFVHIVSGVNEGEEVAVSGVASLTDGAPIAR